MIIESCHVENFGKLHNFDMRFHSGLNSICGENGMGKSTLASFILVMFYGFANERKRDPLENERHRFAPWQRGVYGGTVTFSCHGKRYRMDRTFGTKNNKDDSLSVYDADTGLAVDEFGEVPGEVIFSIDRDSFERTVFVAQEDCGTSVTSDINAKIGNISSETADMGQYDDVQKKLKEVSDSLNPNRKTGEVARLNHRIAELSADVNLKSVSEASADGFQQEITRLTEQKTELEKRQDTVSAELSELSEWSSLQAVRVQEETLRESEENAQRAVKQQEAGFPGRVPSEAEVQAQIGNARAAEKLALTAEHGALSEEEKEEYGRLSAKFADSVPTEQEISDAEKETRKIREKQRLVAGLRLSPDEETRLAAEERTFAHGVPSAEEIDSIVHAWDERTRRKSAISAKRSAAERMLSLEEQAASGSREFRENSGGEKKSGGSAGPLLIVFALVLIAAGVWLTAGAGNHAGMTVIFIGAVLAVIGIIISGHSRGRDSGSGMEAALEQKRAQSRKGYDELQREIADDGQMIRETEERVSEFFSSLGIETGEENVSLVLYKIRSDASDYRVLKKRAARYERAEEEAADAEQEAGVTGLIRMYEPEAGEQNIEQAVQKLRYDVKAYLEYQRRVRRTNDAVREKQDKENSVREFLLSAGIAPADDLEQQLLMTLDEVRSLDRLRMIWQTDQKAREQFEAENRDKLDKLKTMRAPVTGASADELGAQFRSLKDGIRSCSEAIAGYDKQLEKASQRLDDISAEEDELAELTEKRDALQHKYDIVCRTRDYLERAKINFSARYMAPIKKAFDEYYDLLSNGDEKEYELDANLNISVREAGELRDTGFLSEGYKDMIGLCRRMALIDAMYQGEKPFLVFDDPFVSLDDKRLAGAIDFMKKIGEKYQIIYFTCQSDRA